MDVSLMDVSLMDVSLMDKESSTTKEKPSEPKPQPSFMQTVITVFNSLFVYSHQSSLTPLFFVFFSLISHMVFFG